MGTDVRLCHVWFFFFFLKEDLPNLWVMFIGLLPYLKHLERHEANYDYFLLIGDLIAGPRHALKKLAPTFSDIKSQHGYSKQYL